MPSSVSSALFSRTDVIGHSLPGARWRRSGNEFPNGTRAGGGAIKAGVVKEGGRAHFKQLSIESGTNFREGEREQLAQFTHHLACDVHRSSAGVPKMQSDKQDGRVIACAVATGSVIDSLFTMPSNNFSTQKSVCVACECKAARQTKEKGSCSVVEPL